MKGFLFLTVVAGTLLGLSAASARTTFQKTCPHHGGGSCLGVLQAGTYSTVRFTPKLTYTVPAGWANYDDTLGNFSLSPPGVSLSLAENAIDDIMVFANVQALAMSCGVNGDAPAANVPRTASAIAQWLAHHRGLRATQPKPTTIGGLSGYMLTVRLAPTGGIRCGGGGPARNAPIIKGVGLSDGQYWIGGTADHALIYLLDVGGSALGIVADSTGKHPPSLAADATVIEHFQFKASH